MFDNDNNNGRVIQSITDKYQTFTLNTKQTFKNEK